jgi:hypothetical protein
MLVEKQDADTRRHAEPNDFPILLPKSRGDRRLSRTWRRHPITAQMASAGRARSDVLFRDDRMGQIGAGSATE